MLARSRSLRTSLRLSRLDNLLRSACLASASTVGCVQNLSYGAESSVYLTRDIPPLRRSQFMPCSLKQCTATTPITLHSPLYTLNFAQRLRTGKRHRKAGRGRKARPKTERRAAAGGRFVAGAPRRERGDGAVFRDEATRRGSAADGAGGRTLPPEGRDEGETCDPSAKTCHARAISPPTAERTASGRARIRQDSPPTAYMYTPSGAKDAEAASPGAGVPLSIARDRRPSRQRRSLEACEIARMLTRHSTQTRCLHANEAAQRLGMLWQHKKNG